MPNESETTKDEATELRKALQFVYDISGEELVYTQVGTGAEVALRHINRKAAEVLNVEAD